MWHMQQSIGSRCFLEAAPRHIFLAAVVSRKIRLNYVVLNMLKLTGRQQQNNINCDESESECNGERARSNEGNEQLTAARMNCIASERRVAIHYSICTKRNERRRNNCKNLRRVLRTKHN